MSDTPYTTPPWRSVKPLWHSPSYVRFIVDANDNLIARVDFANPKQSENEAIANSEVMAAAPKLLEAAMRVVELSDRFSLSYSTYDMAVAIGALKFAVGEALKVNSISKRGG